jgi:hypothetical protein
LANRLRAVVALPVDDRFSMEAWRPDAVHHQAVRLVSEFVDAGPEYRGDVRVDRPARDPVLS